MLCRGKPPESTRDKLPTEEMDSTLLGRLLDCIGEWLHWECLVFRRGTILYQDCWGCLFKEYLYTPLGNVEIFWGYPSSIRLTVGQLCLGRALLTCWGYCAFSGLSGYQLCSGESIADFVLLCGEWRYLGYVLQLNLPWYLGG